MALFRNMDGALSEVEQRTLLGWERFFDELCAFIRSANRQVGTATVNFGEYAVDRLEIFIVSVTSLIYHFQANTPSGEEELGALFSSFLHELLDCLSDMLRDWQHFVNHYQWRNATSYLSHATHTARRGRPKFNITVDQLQYLRSMSFTWVQIAKMVGVSYMTIYRRKREFGMVETPGGDITDRELQDVLRQMKSNFPSLGQTMVWGRLRSMGIRVSRARVRDAIRATDPIQSALRWNEMTSRRPYSVPGPNSLWHLGKYTWWLGLSKLL